MEVTSCLIAGLGVADQSLISFILLVNSRERKDIYAQVPCCWTEPTEIKSKINSCLRIVSVICRMEAGLIFS